MAFPNVLFGFDGDQFTINTATAGNENAPSVGDQMMLQDGRKYRWSQAGAVAVVVGKLYQAPIPVPAHVLQTMNASAAVGSTLPVLVLGATAVTVNQYENGYLTV